MERTIPRPNAQKILSHLSVERDVGKWRAMGERISMDRAWPKQSHILEKLSFNDQIGDQAADQESGGRGRDTGKKQKNVTETLIWRTLVAERV